MPIFFFNKQKDIKFSKYADKLPKFNQELKSSFLNLIDDEMGDWSFNAENFIQDVNTHEGYIVIFQDSYERMWYDTIADNIDVLKDFIKKENGKDIEMGCSQYIDCIIYKGEKIEIEF